MADLMISQSKESVMGNLPAQSVVKDSASVSSGNLGEIQSLRPHPRPSAAKPDFYQDSQMIWTHTEVYIEWVKEGLHNEQTLCGPDCLREEAASVTADRQGATTLIRMVTSVTRLPLDTC